MAGDMETVAREIARLEAKLSELRAELRTPLEEEELHTDPVNILTGWVGDERVAFLVRSISEVVPMPQVMALPEAPAWITGLLDLHGQLIPVVDVEARIARSPRIVRANDFLVVCTDREEPVGLVLGGIEKVQPLPSSRFVAPSTDVSMAPYVLRVARDDRGAMLLLSVERLARTSNLPRVPHEQS